MTVFGTGPKNDLRKVRLIKQNVICYLFSLELDAHGTTLDFGHVEMIERLDGFVFGGELNEPVVAPPSLAALDDAPERPKDLEQVGFLERRVQVTYEKRLGSAFGGHCDFSRFFSRLKQGN